MFSIFIENNKGKPVLTPTKVLFSVRSRGSPYGYFKAKEISRTKMQKNRAGERTRFLYLHKKHFVMKGHNRVMP